MAVYTRINGKDLSQIEKSFNIGKILNFSGIKKGIENTNYLLKTNRKKIILTIFEKRVKKKIYLFLWNLCLGYLSKKLNVPSP